MKAVLYAEDSPDDIFFMRRAFKHSAPETLLLTVENGAEAIAYLEGKDRYQDRDTHPVPDLVLLDINMPITSGFGVLEWIRKNAGLEKLPVFILTSSNYDGDREKAAHLGADGYLVKPTRPDKLSELLDGLKKYWG